MLNRYILNLNIQSNGDYEVHKEGCNNFPSSNFVELGNHLTCESALRKAKDLYTVRKIDRCKHCVLACHTS